MMRLDERSELAGMIRRHIAERRERELELLGLLHDLLDVLRLVRRCLPAAGEDEERPRPN